MSPQARPGRNWSAGSALPYWLEEFGQLKWAVATLAGALALAAVLLLLSEGYRDEAVAGEQQAQQARDLDYRRLSQADEEKRDIRAYQPAFLALRSKGLIGAENRLNWTEQLRLIQEERKLLPLSYEITPQQAVPPEPNLDLGSYQLHSSRMQVHLDLLHELDLFNLFADLRKHSYFTVQRCSLQRLAESGNPEAGATPTLSADCTLNWLTLAAPAGAPATETKAAQ